MEKPVETDITGFILARLDEDEAAAVDSGGGGWWTAEEIMRWMHTSHSDAAHIARYDPARVLREVKAMRQAVFALDMTGRPTTMSEQPSPTAGMARLALRHLAAVWSGHPDYRQEWGWG